MIKRVIWTGTKEDKQELIKKYSAMRLKEEQRYKDGNWLIFTDEPYIEPEPPRNLEAEIDEIKADVKLIKDKLFKK